MNHCSLMNIKKTDANWIQANIRKENTMKILFSDEKMFDIDGICNSQNDRISGVGELIIQLPIPKGDIRQKRKRLLGR